MLGQEGGIANLAGDPGGYTKYGIAQAFHPGVDVAALDLARAEAIYHAEYWVGAGCSDLAWPINVCHFDAAVNLGNSAAGSLLRRDDGKSAADLLRARREYYQSLRNFASFGAGWLRRIDDLAEYIKGAI